MDARDICRRLNCSPITLSGWVDMGCPVHRHPPSAGFSADEVRQWLADNGISEWHRENDHDLDAPLRVILRALQRREITPTQAESVITNPGSGIWG